MLGVACGARGPSWPLVAWLASWRWLGSRHLADWTGKTVLLLLRAGQVVLGNAMEPLSVIGVVLLAVVAAEAHQRDGLQPLGGLAARGVRGDVYRTLDAVERLAQFMAMHEDAATRDLALGAAIAEGAVQAAVDAVRAAGPGGGGAELDALAERLDALAAELRKAVHAELDLADGQGWRRLLQPRLWRVDAGRAAPPPGRAEDDDDDLDDASAARTLLTLRELALQGSPTEAESARCVGLLLQRPCRVDEQCVRTETRGPASGYTATHRLLYHHVASQVGCGDAALGVGTEDVVEHLCRRILVEAKAIARAQFPPLLRDLFAEQVALCGLRGFAQFARRPWLAEVLAWQRPAGCFGNYTELQEAAQPFHVLADNARLDDRLGSECVAHLTGVAAAAVAFGLRVAVLDLLGVDGVLRGAQDRSIQ